MEEEGRLDLFFGNAGISIIADPKLLNVKDEVERAVGHLRGLAKPISDVREDEFERIMRINALR
jgi:NAD(P)-dependent dehydrogenase (short-subunit alcohol dehydrogenase family)